VPMIPLFPYWHLPFGHDGMTIASTSNALLSVSAHHMASTYVPGVEGLSWSALGHGGARADDNQRVKRWLENAGAGQHGVAMGSATLLAMIGRALRWLLAAAGKLVMGSVGIALTAGATVLDQLAWLLGHAAQLSKDIGSQLKSLIGAIFSFLGRKMVGAADVTVAFLRWVLALLFESLRAVALRAMALVS
jgi:triacylglycerol lipase